MFINMHIIMTRGIIEHMTIIRFPRHRYITKMDITRVTSIIIAVLFSGQEQTAGILVQPAKLSYDVVLNGLNISTYPFQKFIV